MPQIDVITIFPEYFHDSLQLSILKKAQTAGIIKINLHQLRDYASDKRGSVDDKPFGGGEGMILMIEPIYKAVTSIKKNSKFKNKETRTILLTPQGKLFNQKKANELCKYQQLILICGHYEGVDERVKEILVDEEISIGDYVLTGGELPALVIIDAVTRLLPKVLKTKNTPLNESFQLHTKDKASLLLEYPQYTRPAD